MAVPYRDLYQLLGVDRDALPADIAQAYRRRARAVHPDSRPEDPDSPGAFRALAAAYQVLSHPGRRAAYDRTLRPQPPRARRPVSAPGPPLWAGPVRIEGWTADRDRGERDWFRLAALADLAAWYLAEDRYPRDWYPGGGWPR